MNLRIMESFAVRYHEENPGVFSCSDTAWVLAFGLMMLNTDMYNRNIKVREVIALVVVMDGEASLSIVLNSYVQPPAIHG